MCICFTFAQKKFIANKESSVTKLHSVAITKMIWNTCQFDAQNTTVHLNLNYTTQVPPSCDQRHRPEA